MKIKKLIMFVSSLVLSAACIMGASCTPADTGDSGDNNQNQEQPGEDNPGEDNPGEDNPGEDNPGEDNPGEDNPGEDNPGEDNPGEDVPVVSDTVTFAQTANESAAFEWEESSASGASVEYKLSSDSAYTPVDEELIRQISDDTARVDILGLKGGENYDFRITTGADEVIDIPSVAISAYDRSGYAHFNYSDGVGAYSDDGTLKDNAIVVYVSEETKNTVTANIGGRTYTGIVEILQNARRSSNPLNVRIIGTIGAATWQEIDYNANGNYNSSHHIKADEVIGLNGQPLPKQRLYQDDIIAGGYNSLDESVYSELEGLTNRISYDDENNEFDSYYNMCDVSDARNVTVEGVGEDAGIFQWGFTWSNCNSVEVRNLTFDDYTEDACSFQGSENADTVDTFDAQHIWIHHNTFNEGINYWDVCGEQDKHEGDGGTDLTRVSYVSVAYNHYYNCHKTGLVGGGNSVRGANITFHHNWYEQCGSRLPLARQANMHMYNNYYDGTTGTNMSLRAGAFAFIENCYFDNANHPIQTDEGDGRDAFAKVYNSIFVGDQIESGQNVTEVDDRAERVGNTDNFLGEEYYYFDTNSDVFYYDEANNRSDVEVMHDTSEIATLVPSLAGTLHRSFNVDLGNASYKEAQQSVVTTYSATAVGDRIVLSANAGVNFTCSGGIDSDETQKYSVSNDRINLGGNAAYIKFSVAAKVGQTIKVTVNAAAAADSGISVQSDRAIPSGDTAAALDKNYKDCVFTFTARSDDTCTFTVRRNVASTVYVKSITVQVGG